MTLRTFYRRSGAPTHEDIRRAFRKPDWDATVPFRGASDVGVATEPLTRHPDPEPLPPGPPPGPPRRPADCAWFDVVKIGGKSQLVLLCGMDRWRRHADPAVNYFAHAYDALRVSALRAGWRPDLFGRWCCPRCVMDPAYAAAKPLAHWHPGVPHAAARAGPDPFTSVRCWLERPATEYHYDSSAAYGAGDSADEFWFRVEAEAGAVERTARAAVHGRHEAAR